MTSLQNFNFNDAAIRVVLNDAGEPMFVASDVCRILGIENTAQALSRLDDDEKGIILNDTLGGKQQMSAINESGLYSLILSSRKKDEGVKSFKRWVTHEVLPSIRKTGQYALQQLTPMQMLQQVVNQWVEQEKRNELVDNRLRMVEAKVTTRPEYFTIAGYATLQGVPVSLSTAGKLGRLATQVCKERGYEIEEIPDPRFGRVNSYPAQVLQEVFDTHYTK